jgi:general secretion pathway protein D
VTHTFWKPISRNAIFVTQESEPKRQEYQDEVVKVFYIQNASTANEFTEIFNGVRIGAKLTTGIFQVASQNAIIARGTQDTMALVEKLVHDLDRPKAEVLVDVRVWEVSRSKTSTLGAALQSSTLLSMTPGTTSTSTSTGTTTTTTSGGSILASQIGKLSINNFSLALPSAIAQAIAADSNTRLLDNPQVRVTDGGKGSLKIGQKIPYVSGSLNSAVATPGSIPYATTQFQQIDVGVNIDVQPHVNGPRDISMHIKVEISSVVNTTTIAGVAQPIIGQKINEADVRMKDGEYSLLGGLSSDSDTVGISGLPGFSALPVLGYLFGTRTKDREKDDIVIALVPHIIRAQAIDEQLAEGVLAGTEKMVRVEHRQPPMTALPTGVAPSGTPGRPGTTTPQLPPPGGTAELLPPTNNPRLATGLASSDTSSLLRSPGSGPQSMISRPAASPAPSIASSIPAAPSVPVTVNIQPNTSQPNMQLNTQPPGTEVTPLEGMQQMGLTPDPASTVTPNGGNDNGASASTPSALTAGQDTSVPVVPETEPAATPVVPEVVAPVPVRPLRPEPAPAPAATNPDSASYAAVEPSSVKAGAKKISLMVAPKTAGQAAMAKNKPASTNVVVKVQLASGDKTVSTANATSAPHTTKPTAAKAAAKASAAPVQLLEGHLTQEPDTSAPPKQK